MKEKEPFVYSPTFLIRELLSPQQHYDWGLRALKTVLKGSGFLVTQEKAKGDAKKSEFQPKKEKKNFDLFCGAVESDVEYQLVVQALRLNTLSKLTFADCKRFDGLVKDIFPGIPIQEVQYAELEAALREACNDLNLLVIESQVRRKTNEETNKNNKLLLLFFVFVFRFARLWSFTSS